MKAINKNGTIIIYPDVPKSFTSDQGVHLNAPNMSEEALKHAGLFDVVISGDYDERVHDLGEIYWDSKNTVFKKDLVDKTWAETLQELKDKKIKNFKSLINDELRITDWYIIRKADNGNEIPEDVQSERLRLRNHADSVETEINALTTKKDVVLYDFPNI